MGTHSLRQNKNNTRSDTACEKHCLIRLGYLQEDLQKSHCWSRSAGQSGTLSRENIHGLREGTQSPVKEKSEDWRELRKVFLWKISDHPKANNVTGSECPTCSFKDAQLTASWSTSTLTHTPSTAQPPALLGSKSQAPEHYLPDPWICRGKALKLR